MGGRDNMGYRSRRDIYSLRFFKISGTAGYLKAEFDSVLPPQGGTPFQPITIDSKFPNTPEFQSSISPEFTFPIGMRYQAKAKVDWIYSSSVHQTFENDPELFQPSYSTFDGSISLEDEDNDWGVSLGVHNLSNKRIKIGGGIGRVPSFGDVNYNAPREWYVNLRKGF